MKKLLQLLFVLALVQALPAQQPSTAKEIQEASRPSETAYKINFKIYELEDGKRINERTYIFPAVSTPSNQRQRRSGIKVGLRTPITVKEHETTYLDVGINIDCYLEDMEGKLMANISLELSNFAMPDQMEDPRHGGDPVLRQMKQDFRLQLPVGKPVSVTSVDDINSKKRTQIEVTATRFE
jgi:hypothetical protein